MTLNKHIVSMVKNISKFRKIRTLLLTVMIALISLRFLVLLSREKGGAGKTGECAGLGGSERKDSA